MSSSGDLIICNKFVFLCEADCSSYMWTCSLNNKYKCVLKESVMIVIDQNVLKAFFWFYILNNDILIWDNLK